jgi:hypothetical protein
MIAHRLAWVLVVLMAAGLVYGAVLTRYEYHIARGFYRIDRWTGRVQRYERECITPGGWRVPWSPLGMAKDVVCYREWRNLD